jgi:hypothetical protein
LLQDYAATQLEQVAADLRIRALRGQGFLTTRATDDEIVKAEIRAWTAFQDLPAFLFTDEDLHGEAENHGD